METAEQMQAHELQVLGSAAILAQEPCLFECARERFWFCLVQVSTNQFSLFAAFASVFMATDRACEDAMHTSLPGSPPLSSNVGSRNRSGHDLDGVGHRSIDAQFKELRDVLLPLARGFAEFDNHVKTLSEAVGMVTSRIASVEQTVNALSAKMASFAASEQNGSTLTARLCKIEGDMVSALSFSGSARSWNILGHSDGSTAAGSLGSHGPGSSVDNRNTQRRLNTSSSTEDEQSRGAVLFRFPCEQYLKGLTKWIDTLWEESNFWRVTDLSEVIAKQVSSRLVFETRGKC